MKKEKLVRALLILLVVALSTVWYFRRDIAEMEITKKKLEFFKAVYDQDLDSAQHILREVVDSSFYLK